VSSSALSSGARRLDSLTGLRWWAAFGVFLFHMRNMVTFPPELQWIVANGHLGVTFFFVLSGFVLTWSWKRNTPVRAFYWRRFARIYPLHLIALVLAVPVFYSISARPEDWWVKPLDWSVLGLSVLVIQGWWLAPSILFSGNPAAWTLTVEAFFYALHPAIVRVAGRLSARRALVVAGGVLLLAAMLRLGIAVWPDGPLAHLPEPIMHLPSFIVGLLLAWAYREGWRLRVPVALPAFAMGIWLLLAALPAASALRAAFAFTPEIVTALCALVIAASASRELDGRPGLNASRPLVALGEWSFAFYLVHATLVYTAISVVGTQQGSAAHTVMWSAMLLAVALVSSWLLHRFIERPLERRLRGWQDLRLSAESGGKAKASR